MQIVIDIPKGIIKDAKDSPNYYPSYLFEKIWKAVAKGTVLPKGHGRLIDAEELKKDYPHDEDWDYPVNTNSYVVESIDNAHTIIEADRNEK